RREAMQESLQIALKDPDRNPVQIAQIHAQIEEQERQHQQRMLEIESRKRIESSKTWAGGMRQMEGGFKNALGTMMRGQMSFAQGMKDMTATTVGSVIDMIAQMVVQWSVAQLAQLVGMKTTGASTIATRASEAGAAGVASMAGAPWPLNMSAPAFGAAMSANALAYSVGLSAAGGFDVPPGLNPVTQLHQSEMVLPAELANAVRGMAAGGGGGRVRDVHIHSNDAASVRKLFAREGRTLAAVLQKQMNGRFYR
ncbi:MAG: hypothetical protein KDI87_07905, partial [Gammaproteobacteria bacterium]|nr:hypothetical protein [Gammaproteobacteria bacterium]